VYGAKLAEEAERYVLVLLLAHRYFFKPRCGCCVCGTLASCCARVLRFVAFVCVIRAQRAAFLGVARSGVFPCVGGWGGGGFAWCRGCRGCARRQPAVSVARAGGAPCFCTLSSRVLRWWCAPGHPMRTRFWQRVMLACR
jgi:hypothetical protein